MVYMANSDNASKGFNPLALDGIEFIEYSGPNPDAMRELFTSFGFSMTHKHKLKNIEYFNQGDIHFLLNTEQGSFAESFFKSHGPCVSAMGWRVKDAKKALATAIERGAKKAENGDYLDQQGQPIPAIVGIGDSLIYLIEDYTDAARYQKLGFEPHPTPRKIESKGFYVIDHLTNNVPQGTMTEWSEFYRNVFGFTDVRYFDIKGAKTGLTSYALRSPCTKFCIPINEGTEAKSQINEYLREYKGPGVQHIAFATNDIVASLRALKSTAIETLDIDDQYYQEVFDRVPNVSENHKELQELGILVDGDQEGYLLQIFTRNIIGPIFIEIIQRKNHHAFGEGNFGALFRSIERDQEKRGVL
jgi:4-hydroxyphenylpyruvate dioxygenase